MVIKVHLNQSQGYCETHRLDSLSHWVFLVQRLLFISIIKLVCFCYRQIEGKVVEISQLQEIFSEKVLHQVRKPFETLMSLDS